MINNSRAGARRTRRPALLAATAIWLAACETGRAPAPAPLQGVIEYEDRVLSFEMTGRVTAVEVARGQRLPAASLIARLDDGLERPLRDLRAAELAAAEAQLQLLKAGARGEELRASQAEIASLDAQAQLLEKNLARQRLLFEQDAIAQNVLDDTTGQLRSTQDRKRALEERLALLRRGARGEEIAAAVARVQAAAAALAAQDARLARYTLSTPVAGEVTDVHVETGELAAMLSPAVTLIDRSRPYVDVFVPEARMHAIRVGQTLQVRVDGLSQALPGAVEHIFPRTEFTPRFLFSEDERPNLVLRVRVRITDTAQVLHAGLPAFASLRGAEARQP